MYAVVTKINENFLCFSHWILWYEYEVIIHVILVIHN